MSSGIKAVRLSGALAIAVLVAIASPGLTMAKPLYFRCNGTRSIDSNHEPGITAAGRSETIYFSIDAANRVFEVGYPDDAGFFDNNCDSRTTKCAFSDSYFLSDDRIQHADGGYTTNDYLISRKSGQYKQLFISSSGPPLLWEDKAISAGHCVPGSNPFVGPEGQQPRRRHRAHP
jgi:hypothetical protein